MSSMVTECVAENVIIKCFKVPIHLFNGTPFFVYVWCEPELSLVQDSSEIIVPKVRETHTTYFSVLNEQLMCTPNSLTYSGKSMTGKWCV